MIDINENIQVIAHFKDGQLLPRKFAWQKRSYKIEKILGTYISRDGRYQSYYYAVLAASNVYEICLDLKGMNWRLTKIQQEEF